MSGHSPHKRLLHIVNFYSVPESERDFLRFRHSVDSRLFLPFQDTYALSYLKLENHPSDSAAHTSNEVFFKGKNRFFFMPFALCRHVKKERPDILFVHGFIFPVQLLVLRWFKPKQTKLIIQHHAEKPFAHPVKRWFQKIAYPQADAFLFASLALAKPYLETGIIKDKRKLHEVMEGSTLFTPIPKTEARAALNIDKEPVFLWVGRLDANKDPLTVLKAMRLYKDAGNPFRLYMIYGTNELEKEVGDYTREHALQENVVLIGKTEHEALESWYSAADYFVAASHYEGSGIALCEAMACGCIPIVSNIASFSAMTVQGQYGLLFEAGNEQGLFEKLLSLKHLDANTMSASVMQHFQAHLSTEAIGKRFLAIAKSLLRE